MIAAMCSSKHSKSAQVGEVIFVEDTFDIPVGFIVPDGSEVRKSHFPELYKVIGHRYESSAGSGYSSDWFCLPDLRGVFKEELLLVENDGDDDICYFDRTGISNG